MKTEGVSKRGGKGDGEGTGKQDEDRQSIITHVYKSTLSNLKIMERKRGIQTQNRIFFILKEGNLSVSNNNMNELGELKGK